MSQCRFFSIEQWFTIWESKVVTHLTYNIGSWKTKAWEQAERLIRKQAIFILGHEKRSANAAVYDELKITDWQTKIDTAILRL